MEWRVRLACDSAGNYNYYMLCSIPALVHGYLHTGAAVALAAKAFEKALSPDILGLIEKGLHVYPPYLARCPSNATNCLYLRGYFVVLDETPNIGSPKVIITENKSQLRKRPYGVRAACGSFSPTWCSKV